MRPIKFRGQRVDTGAWVFGNLVNVRDGNTSRYYPCIVISYNNDSFDWIEVIPETVSQFTGLLDKNGKEVYEGDIIKISKHEIPGIIKWDNHCLCFLCEWTNMPTAGDIGYLVNCCLLEVVGTALDNPELLEGGKPCI